jgi:ABC-type transporter Mla MlaB component
MSFGLRGGHFVAMPASAPSTVAFAIRGPIARADLPGLCERVCALLGGSAADVALCDVRGIVPDAVTVDALARLQLAARRYGCQVRLRGASPELRELVVFMGLSDVLPYQEDPAGRRAGSPKSGKSVSVPRKNVSSAIRPPASSSTWSAHGS